MSSLVLFFRIIYRIFYTLLHVLLIALLLVTPGDIINQSRLRGNLYPILIVGIAYVLTITFVVFVYFTRLYLNQTVLKSIPKSWIPIEKGDVSHHVRKMIVASLSRSAAIAFTSRPRIAPPEVPGSSGNQAEEKKEEHKEPRAKSFQLLWLKKTATVEEEMGINLPPHRPVWGHIEHVGWASPESPDLPNLQYGTVVSELPNLIEAKALTLAPRDLSSPTDPPPLDPSAVSLLQIPANMGLRDYLAHLTELGVLVASPTIADFTAMYEHARFSTTMISNARFRELMHNFAEILRSMEPLDPASLEAEDDDESVPSEADPGGDGPARATPATPGSRRTRSSSVDTGPRPSSASTSSGGSRIVRRPPLPARNSSANTWQLYRTAPTTPKSRRTGVSLSRSSSTSTRTNNFAQTRQPYPISQASSTSLRSAASSTAGSVIRLSERRDSTTLPYVLSPPGPP